jgi:hypothetical protein
MILSFYSFKKINMFCFWNRSFVQVGPYDSMECRWVDINGHRVIIPINSIYEELIRAS